MGFVVSTAEKNKGGRPRSASPKNTALYIRMTPAQVEEIDLAADLCGMDRSKFVRASVLSQAREILGKKTKRKEVKIK